MTGPAGRGRPGGRLLRFAGVGAAGFVVQLAVLQALSQAGVHYLVATALAVEAAILHNYLWHERWTWGDRPAPLRRRWSRAWRFNTLTALTSVAGNLGLMLLLAGRLGLPLLLANAMSVGLLSLVTYLAADRLVFQPWTTDGAGNPEPDGEPGSLSW